MNKKKDFSMNIGLPSIMLIFVTLCLISFGVLSLVSANADLKLSQKVLARQIAYYDSCNQAEEYLCQLNNSLNEAFYQSDNSTDYFDKINYFENKVCFPITDIQNLEIELEYLDPYNLTEENTDKKLYKIISWKVKTNDSLDYDSSLHLYEIEDIE